MGRQVTPIALISQFTINFRMWEFAVPIILTTIFTDTILPASAFPFVTQLACVLFGTLVGIKIQSPDSKSLTLLSR